MSLETYDVFFAGQIMKDQDPAQVRQKIGKLFKLEGARLERLFSGQPVAIKKNVEMEQAIKYRVVFREAGALVDIRPCEARATPAPAAGATAAPAPRPVTPPRPAPTSDATGLSLSAPNGYDLSDCSPPVQARELPDISALALDKPGVTLDTSAAPTPLQIDTEDWSLELPGTTLDDTPPPPLRQIDTSDLVLNPPRQGSLEDCRQEAPAAPLPDIGHLGFAEAEAAPTGRSRFDLPED